jgi:cytochrome P450 enzyme
MIQNEREQSAQPAIDFRPYAPGFDENPHPVFQQLREQAPVYYWADGRAWIVSKHDDILSLVRDKRFTPDRAKWEHAGGGGIDHISPELQELNREGLFSLSDQAHARVRKLVSPALTPRAIERLRPEIQAIVDDVLDAVAAKGTIEVVSDFADQIPARVIGSMLKIPRGREQLFQNFTYAVVKTFMPGLVATEDIPGLRRDIAEGIRLVSETIEERRHNPLEDDILTNLIQTEEQGDRLSKPELLSLVSALIVGGFETTVHLIGFTVLNMLRRPEVFEQVKAEPDLVKNLVEEVLRHDNFGKLGIARYALEDVEISGVTIKKGQMAILSLGSGLRDESVYDKAETFDIRRNTTASIAFGNGAHFCIGANLARLELQVAIATMIRRFPEMRMASEPTFGPHPVIRKLDKLLVDLRPSMN